jgi:uncharacterized integral membrane protein
MKKLGIFLIILALIVCFYSLSMDTSVQVDYPFGKSYGLPLTVSNIHLMNLQRNYLFIAGIIFLAAVVILVGDSLKKKDIVMVDNNIKENTELSPVQKWLNDNPEKSINDYYKNIK